MIEFRKKYAPSLCEYQSGFEEIRWDVMGCNLACHFCWSPASRPNNLSEQKVSKSPEEIINNTVSLIRNPSRTFIRFTGGEPSLYWNDIVQTISLLTNSAASQIPVLIQTNGIKIGENECNIEELASLETHILFELSFKGTNREEFSILTNKSPDLYFSQLQAYKKLDELSKNNSNIRVVAVLGVYHSSVKQHSKYAFVSPRDGSILFDKEELWDKDFRQIWQTAKLKWVEPLRMSPKGVWDNLFKRCGPQGCKILRYYPERIPTNVNFVFPIKPKSFDYARMIVQGRFW